MSMTPLEAAALLSVPVDEIAEVGDSPAGPVILTTDGVTYVHVGEDTPDAFGRHGLMYLVAPDPQRVYTMPVYAQAGAELLVSPITEPLGPQAEADLIDALHHPAVEELTPQDAGADLDTDLENFDPARGKLPSVVDTGEVPADDADGITGIVAGDEVPDKAADVVAWVGSDATRAGRAWAVESNRAQGPRKTVEDHVTALLEDPGA